MILITGGLGFVGTNLVERLLVSGHRVKILDNFTFENPYKLSPSSSLTITKGDIVNYKEVAFAMEGISTVIHLAAAGSVVDSVANPRFNFNVNVMGTFNVLEAARDQGVNKIIFSSTGGALIGNAPLPVSEVSLPEPISPYGASKLACEAYIGAYAKSFEMQAITLRFANVIGRNSAHKKGLITKVIKAIKSNEEIIIYGDGSATRDFIDVRDLCDGIVLALKKLSNSAGHGFHEKYHLASGNKVTVIDLVNKLASLSNTPNPRIVFAEARAGEVANNFASFDKASRALGFKPVFSLNETLKDTWDWFSENGF